MKNAMLAVIVCAALTGCGKKPMSEGAYGTEGLYQKKIEQVQAGAAPTAADIRPDGGGMPGAGGAGPGYDGSGQGLGRYGTIPAPGSGFASGLTNSNVTVTLPPGRAGRH